ncbi:hypothetical protein, partial [Marinobacter sediminum]|uniref:hypothetical protein n=1 Tax=Marinobacter sediminum TaxID=256323 RepID=UPI001EED588F
VKQACADGSVAFAHVRVGHRQTLNTENPSFAEVGVFYCLNEKPRRGLFRKKWRATLSFLFAWCLIRRYPFFKLDTVS